MNRLAVLAIAMIAAPALAQDRPPACARAEVVPGFAAWSGAAGTALAVGSPAMLALAPATGQAFAPPLGRPPEPGSYGGTFPLAIATAGTYRIALSAGAWIDVIAAGTRLPTGAHQHGPACSGIAKIVDFTLPAGDYRVQISAAKSAAIEAMVVSAKPD